MEVVTTFLKVCTVNLIVRLLETSVMELTPNNLMMQSETVLTQYIITNWWAQVKFQNKQKIKTKIVHKILTQTQYIITNWWAQDHPHPPPP